MSDNAREARVRRALRKDGFLVMKSRVSTPNLDNLGGYMVVNARNWVVLGSRYDLSLEDLEAWVKK